MINSKILSSENYLWYLIIILGLIFRLLYLNKPLLEFFPERQTQTAEIARNIYVNGFSDFIAPKVRYFTGYPIVYALEFPIYAGIVAIAYNIITPSLILGRAVSLLAYIGSSILFFKLMQDKISKKALLFSLIFFVFSPIHVLISRSFQPDELSLIFLLAALYFNSFFFVMLSGLSKASSIIFGLNVLLTRKISFIKKVSVFAVFIVPIVIWSIYAKKITYSSLQSAYTLSNWFIPKDFLTLRWYFSVFQIEHIWVLTTLGLLFYVIGVVKYFNNKKLRVWRNWLLLSLIYFAVFNYHVSTHEYYHLFLVPPAAVYVGLGLCETLNLFKSFRFIVRLVICILVIGTFILGLITPAYLKIKNSPSSVFNQTFVPRQRYDGISDF